MTDTTRIELTAADRAAVSALLTRAETIRAWLLGRRESERRMEMLARTQTWGASRSWASRSAFGAEAIYDEQRHS